MKVVLQSTLCKIGGHPSASPYREFIFCHQNNAVVNPSVGNVDRKFPVQ